MRGIEEEAERIVCLATGCRYRSLAGNLFCPRHWSKLPPTVQGELSDGIPDTADYDLAAQEAVVYLEKVDGLC